MNLRNRKKCCWPRQQSDKRNLSAGQKCTFRKHLRQDLPSSSHEDKWGDGDGLDSDLHDSVTKSLIQVVLACLTLVS